MMRIDAWIQSNLDRLFISYKANQKRIPLHKQQTQKKDHSSKLEKVKFSEKDDLEIKFKVEDKHDFITRDDMKKEFIESINYQ